jgi:hypothetical protein
MSEIKCANCGQDRLEHPNGLGSRLGNCPSFTARPDEAKGDSDLFQRAVRFDRYERDVNVTSADNLMTFVSREIEPVQKKADLFEQLARIYDLEQNVEISSFWDGGWTLRFGDRMNGFTKAEGGHTLESLIQALAKYPAQTSSSTSEDATVAESK